MQNMKTLILIMAILALIIYSGLYSLLDDYVLAWIPSAWIVPAQTILAPFIGLSIFAYATLYLYYVFKRTDEHTSL